MSYQVLARKWRPKNFTTLVGQEHVVRALSHALSSGRLHHAYLFTGTRGIGKTTIARILAKSLNCEQGVSADPCCQCSSCIEIDAGRFVDLIEVDAATNTRVEEMRQLLENAVYAPTRGRYKIYVIDEVHMLSNSAFNAMLKTLEEPPDHVKFILATTDPQKIPVTVLSRCLQFNLKQMSPSAIGNHLATILDAEGIDHQRPALQLIAQAAAGSMRDALSLLDQAIAHGGGKIETTAVGDMLGNVENDHLFALLEALLNDDVAALIALADDMAARSLAFEGALGALCSLLTRIQIAQLTRTLSDDVADRERILALAERFSPETVQLAYQIAVHGLRDLPLAPDPYTGFVMTMLRLAAFTPEEPDPSAPRTPPSPKRAVTKKPARTATVGQDGDDTAQKTIESATESKAPAQPIKNEVLAKSTVNAAESAPETKAGSGKINGAEPDWSEWLSQMALTGMARELAHHCLLCACEEKQIRLSLQPLHRYLLSKPAQTKIEKALSDYLERPVSVHIDITEVDGITPAQAARQEYEDRRNQAVVAIESDLRVQELIELLDATLVDTSIKPN